MCQGVSWLAADPNTTSAQTTEVTGTRGSCVLFSADWLRHVPCGDDTEVEEWKQKHSRVFSSSVWVTFAQHPCGQRNSHVETRGQGTKGQGNRTACLVREIKLSNHMAREVGYSGREIGAINAISLLHHDNRPTDM